MNEPPSLLRNDAPPRQSLDKSPIGRNVHSNRSAIGSRVVVRYGGKDAGSGSHEPVRAISLRMIRRLALWSGSECQPPMSRSAGRMARREKFPKRRRESAGHDPRGRGHCKRAALSLMPFQSPANQFAGSVTLRMRSASTFCMDCTFPDGQWISIESARASGPRPKCTGPSLDDA
jgi:hypothetical protein